MSAPGGAEADRAARERLAREARVTATTLLDWVGTRVEGAATTRGAGAGRPPQSPGPCGWCPVCALIAAVRGEQPELTAHLAEQASSLLVLLRLLLQSHVHDHPAHHAAPPEASTEPTPAPSAADPAPEHPADVLADPDVLANPDVPWDAPHAVFDPDPAPAAPAPGGSSRPVPERPTGKRGPRPSPRPRPVPEEPPAAVTTPTPPPPAAVSTGPRPVATPSRTDRGVQRIPVRRRPRPC